MGLSYELYLEPGAHDARKMLPGNIRQRIRRRINALADRPRPRDSRRLRLGTIDSPAELSPPCPR